MRAKKVYENISDILKPKSDEEIFSHLDGLSPNELLSKSAELGFLTGLKKALELGADVHAKDDWALRSAAWNGHKDVVELLLKTGADVHAEGDWALHLAAEKGHKDTVELLLKAGADVHARDDWALRMASEYGHKDTVELLKKYMK